jgi:hypothetical protein
MYVNHSFHLCIVIRPNFLAAVRCLHEILSDGPSLSHLFGKFLVHQTCGKHLECPPLILGLDVTNGVLESKNQMHTWCCDLSSCMETVIPLGM